MNKHIGSKLTVKNIIPENDSCVMHVEIMHEAGYKQAMHGLALSYNQDVNKMRDVSKRLYNKDLGHNKFLESMVAWFMVTAPRYFWQQADTYRISTKQSQSTMHTILKRKLTYNDFEPNGITKSCLADLNKLITAKDFSTLKKRTPESLLQTREWCMSYKTISNIIKQRSAHKLPHWTMFILKVLGLVQHPELLPSWYSDKDHNEPAPTSGEFVKIGQRSVVDNIPWVVHRFCGGNTDKIVIINQSDGTPYSRIISEEEFVQTKLF